MPFITCNPSTLYPPFIRSLLYTKTPLNPLKRAVYRASARSRGSSIHFPPYTKAAKSMPTEFQHDGPTRTLGDTERLSDVVKLSAHVTRILGQNPGQMTLSGTNSYLLQPPSSSLAPMILVDTSSPHTSQQYVDLVLTHLHHLGLQSGIREVHFESEYAADALGHLPKDRDAGEVKVDILRERADNPRATEVDLVEYGPGAQWVINGSGDDGKLARERGFPALEHIILTHRHLDHVGALPTLLKELSKLKLPPPKIWKLPSPDELDLGQSDRNRPTTDAALVNTLPHGLYTPFSPFQPLHPIMPGLMISIIDPEYRHLLKHDRDGKPRWNEVPEIARVSVRCLKTPGHTQDSVSLVMCEGEKGVFTGDTVLGEGTTIFTDLSAYMLSLKTLLAIKPQTLYPGHGKHIPGPTASAAHIEGYIAHRQLREEQILGLLKQIKAGESVDDKKEEGGEKGLIGLLKAFFERKTAAEKAQIKEKKEFMSGKPYIVKPPKGSAEAEAQAAQEKEQAEKDKVAMMKEDDMPPRPGTPPPRKKKGGEEEEEIVHAEPEKPEERHLAFGWNGNGGAVPLALLTRLLYDTDNEKLIEAAKKPTLAHLQKLEGEGKVRRVRVDLPGLVDMTVGEKGAVEAWEMVQD